MDAGWILLLRDGVWWARWQSQTEVREICTGETARPGAEEWLRRHLTREAVPTLGDLRQALVREYRIAGRKSVERVLRAFLALERYFGEERRATELTASALAEYAAVRMERCAPGTVKLELALLAQAMRLMMELGRLRDVPRFPRVRASPPREGFFETEQVEAICEHLPQYLRSLVRFLSLTGWRLNEGVGLRWECLELEAGVLRLEGRRAKSGKGRVFPFGSLPELGKILWNQRTTVDVLERSVARVVPWVFPSREGSRIGGAKGDFRGVWRRACIKAGYPGRCIHDLRRTAVRNLERAGVPRSIAMQLTGHHTESVYQRYDIVNERDLVEGVEKLAGYLRRQRRQGGRRL